MCLNKEMVYPAYPAACDPAYPVLIKINPDCIESAELQAIEKHPSKSISPLKR